MKSMAHYARECRVSRHGYLRQRKIGSSVSGCVSENPVPEFDPCVGGERPAVATNAYSDAVPNDAVRVQHSTERHSSCKAERMKNAVSGRSINRCSNVSRGLSLRTGRSERR